VSDIETPYGVTTVVSVNVHTTPNALVKAHRSGPSVWVSIEDKATLFISRGFIARMREALDAAEREFDDMEAGR